MKIAIRSLAWTALVPGLVGCGATEVVVGEAAGVARIVAGVLGETHVIAFPDTVVSGSALGQPLGSPAGVVGWEDGAFMFADRFRRRLGYVTADGALTWPVGRGICGSPGTGAPDPRMLCLAGPTGLALDGDGTVLVADAAGHRVYRYDPVAGTVAVVLGTGQPGVGAPGTPGPDAPVTQPAAVAVGPNGQVYVAEAGNHRVIRVDGAGNLALVAGRGSAGDEGDGGPAVDALLRSPGGLAWSGDTLFVADAGNHRVRRIVRDTILGYVGLGAAGFAGDRGPAAASLLSRPGALAVVGQLLFVADRDNYRVRIVTLGPDSIDTFMGTGQAAPGPDLLEAGRTAIAVPAGVAAAGRAVFVSDSGGYVVRRVIR